MERKNVHDVANTFERPRSNNRTASNKEEIAVFWTCFHFIYDSLYGSCKFTIVAKAEEPTSSIRLTVRPAFSTTSSLMSATLDGSPIVSSCGIVVLERRAISVAVSWLPPKTILSLVIYEFGGQKGRSLTSKPTDIHDGQPSQVQRTLARSLQLAPWSLLQVQWNGHLAS